MSNLKLASLVMAILVAASNYLVQFPMNDWLTWGAFTYPATYLITELINRVHGPSSARRVVTGKNIMKIACFNKRFYFLVVLLGLGTLGIEFTENRINFVWAAPVTQGVVLILNTSKGEGVQQPRNWRSTSEPIQKHGLSNSELNTHGLEMLHISGSAEFSQAEFLYLKKEKFRDKKVAVIDLRQESHAFINGNAVTWYKRYDSVNQDKSLSEIEIDETARIQLLRAKSEIKLRKIIDRSKSPDPDQWVTETVLMKPLSVKSEEEMLKDFGVSYFRVTAPDYQAPRSEDVDRFTTYVKTLSEDTWIHVHCAAGRGRTTTFMTIYDMMRNYDKASAMEIIHRQEALGGINLAEPSNKSDINRRKWANERTAFIQKFYNYCKAEGPQGFKTLWSKWSRENF